MNIRSMRINSHGSVDCEIEHPVYGWIPFTASQDDTDELGRTLYAEAISGQHGDIAPYIAPIVSLEERIAQVQALRLAAYADPITGSDRYFAEAARLQAMGAAQEEIDAANAAGAARYAEIQGEYPWPA